MEISELLRRGNFSRSQIFLSSHQLSQQSLDYDINQNQNNNHNTQSKSPQKTTTIITQPHLQSKSSINHTRITDQSYSSQLPKEQTYYIHKKNNKNEKYINSQKYPSQISFNDDQNEFNNNNHSINNNSNLDYQKKLQNHIKGQQQYQQFSSEPQIDSISQNDEQNNYNHKFIALKNQYGSVSSQLSLNSPQKSKKQSIQSQKQPQQQQQYQKQQFLPKSQDGKRNNTIISKSLEQDRFKDLLAKTTINFKQNDINSDIKKKTNHHQQNNKSSVGSFNKKILADIFSSTNSSTFNLAPTSSTTTKYDLTNSTLFPKTSKQSILYETAYKSNQPYFKGIKSDNNFNYNKETISQNGLINSKNNIKKVEIDEDNNNNNQDEIKNNKGQIQQNKSYLNMIEEQDFKQPQQQQQQINKQNKIYKSQEKYKQDNTNNLSPSKRINFNVNPFSSALSAKNTNNQKSTLLMNRTRSDIINHDKNTFKNPIMKDNFIEDQFKSNTQKQTLPLTQTQVQLQTQNNSNAQQQQNNRGRTQSQEKLENTEQNGEQKQNKGTLKNKIASIMGIVKMKRKVIELVKKNQEQMKKNKEQNSNDSDNSDKGGYNKLNNNRESLKFPQHNKVVYDLKKEQNCDYHDIYGTFNDKIKQIQEQVLDSLHSYSLAQTVIEQVDKEKKQSRVIDAVENTICSIFVSLDYLDKIPSIMHDREEIDKILAQQAISLMKSTQSNIVIQIETVMIYAKYCRAISNFGKALRLYKQCKNMSISPLMQRYRMKSYKNIGQCFQNLKIYNISLLYFGKYLESAWYLGDTEAELKAYDLLGVTHYLLGDLDTAKFYHEKMIQNDNEPPESNVRSLNAKKMVEKLKKLNSEEYIQKMAVNYKKFFAKIHSIDYEEDYECSSSDDEFKITIPKTSSQKKNQEYDEYIRDLSPNMKKKQDSEKKRFIAIYNAEDRDTQKSIKLQANQNIRMLEFKRTLFQLPAQLKFSSAQSFKPINNTQKTPFRINQFSINRNLDNYMAQDQRILKNQNFDFFKQVEDNNDKKLKHKIIYILSKFQNNLIFALSQIHCIRERDKYKQNKRRFAFSGVADFNKPNNLILMNINISQEQMRLQQEEKKKVKQIEDKSKPNSNKQKFLFIQRYQMNPDVEALLKK